MPATPWGPYQNDLASGLFGTFQKAAAEGADTTTVWEKLREAAGSWLWSTAGRGGEPTPSELQDIGAGVLSSRGIGGATVSTYRGIAGSWLAAKEHLAGREPQEQVEGRDIWQPPWAKTTSSSVPSEYRARAEWRITPSEGESYTKWSTYELQNPLTSRGDVEDEIHAQQQSDPYLALLSGGAPPTIESLEIEQI